jgi:hypothetical protein
VQVSWGEQDGRAVLVVRGLGPWAADVGQPAPARVYPSDVLRDGRPGAGPSMAGRWAVGPSGEAVFVPRFAFLAATSYTVVAIGSPDDGSVAIESPPVTGVGTTRVVGIDPAGPFVPRNLLRLYVRFSAPMSEGQAHRHVRFERVDSGEVLADALLSFDPELWDDDRQRLTVLLDPARIKRGLAPHLEAGYPLREGERVRFVVGAGYPDADGRPLVAGVESAYVVGSDLRGHVRPERWTVGAPTAGTLSPLVVHFDRPLDRPLTVRCIRVPGVGGVGAPTADGRSWWFHPTGVWSAGPVTVTVDPMLEDIAGNSVARVFDRDLDASGDDPVVEPEALTFTVVIPAG